MKQLVQWIRRLSNRPVLAIAAFAALSVVIVPAFAATPVVAQSNPPACSTLVQGTRFSLPPMTTDQEAVMPKVANATVICVEGMEGAEGIALKLKGSVAYTAVSNGTPLTVDAELEAAVALSDPSFNGSLLQASPMLPTVKVVALSGLTEGVSLIVGIPRPKVVSAIAIDQWQDVRIPGSLGELGASTTKWAGNGVEILVSSGAAFSANGTAVLPEVGKVGEYNFYVDAAMELKLEATVNGQRFYLSVAADTVTKDSWLQRRVDPTTATTTTAAKQQGVDDSGACFVSTTCSGTPVACDPTAQKINCTAGDSLSVWQAPVSSPRPLWLPTMLRRTAP